jgi:protein TonB
MVLAQNFADDSPLTPLRLRRAAADTELRKSLVTSSMLALTFCVAVLLARALFFAPAAFRTVEIPVWNPDPRIFEPPPAPVDDIVPSRPATDQGPGEVLPVDRIVKDETDRIAPDAPVVPGPIIEGPPGGTVQVQGRPGVGTAPPPEPTPNEFVFTEKLPMPVTRVKPDYPQIARDAGMEGKVVVRMLVDVDGSVRRAEIETSSAMFDADALAAARRWTFTPALTDGKPVMVWVRVPFDFRLH